MLNIITYLYGKEPYNGKHVQILHNMLKRHLTIPYRFVVVTDQPEEVPAGIDHVPIEHHELLAYGRCWVRLGAWSEWGWTKFGSDVVIIDLDCVIVRNIDHLFNEELTEPKFWRDSLAERGQTPFCYNGGLVRFDPSRLEDQGVFIKFPGPGHVLNSGNSGSDQAWYRLYFGDRMPVWTAAQDGVMSYKFHGLQEGKLPDHACLVFFHGKPKPWEVEKQWVKEHYR